MAIEMNREELLEELRTGASADDLPGHQCHGVRTGRRADGRALDDAALDAPWDLRIHSGADGVFVMYEDAGDEVSLPL